ncbi:iron transporter [Candidatus Gracilibacteria bacterium]|nr:MAG: iron transporter [Candidatus Gracilibacteria bacterium]
MLVNDDETLMTMGINSRKMRIIGNVISSLMTAAVISFTGVIGFVGLIAPHIARMSIGNNYKYLLPASYLIGSLLVLISDTIGRTIFSPVIIPVGIVVSFLGVPIFLRQILSEKGYGLWD